MKKHKYLKRLDRIQVGLQLPTDDKATFTYFTLFGLRNLESAILRASKAGARHVLFVPANGGAIEFVTCRQISHVTTPTIAVAYQIDQPADADFSEPLRHCSSERLRELAGRLLASPDVVAARKESVCLASGNGGKVDFKVFISPEELP